MILPGRGTAGANRARDSGMSTRPARLSLDAFSASFASGAQSAPSITACRSAGALIRNSREAFATSRMPFPVLSPRVPPPSPASVQNVILRARLNVATARCFVMRVSPCLSPSAQCVSEAQDEDQEHPQHQRAPDEADRVLHVVGVGLVAGS